MIEHRAVRRKERQRPRIFERARHRGHANALTLTGVELDRLRRQLVTGKPRRRDRNAAPELHLLLAGSRVNPECHDPQSCEDEPKTIVMRRSVASYPMPLVLCKLPRRRSV